MDIGGLQLGLIEVVGVLVLLVALLWAVSRVKSKGKETSPAVTERATAELYRKEEQRREDGTDSN